MALRGRGLEWAFTIIPPARSGLAQRVARFTCHGCGATTDVSVPGKIPPPEVVGKWGQRTGWTIDPYHASAVRCPECKHGKTRLSVSREPILKPEKVVKMAEVKAAGAPRELSQAERLKVRAMLDKHFDDGAGCWLDGYSDQKAGEEVGVPWAHVTKIREAAYGPIRVDPEIAGLKAELVQIGRDLAALTEKHSAAQKRLDAVLAKRAA